MQTRSHVYKGEFEAYKLSGGSGESRTSTVGGSQSSSWLGPLESLILTVVVDSGLVTFTLSEVRRYIEERFKVGVDRRRLHDAARRLVARGFLWQPKRGLYSIVRGAVEAFYRARVRSLPSRVSGGKAKDSHETRPSAGSAGCVGSTGCAGSFAGSRSSGFVGSTSAGFGGGFAGSGGSGVGVGFARSAGSGGGVAVATVGAGVGVGVGGVWVVGPVFDGVGGVTWSGEVVWGDVGFRRCWRDLVVFREVWKCEVGWVVGGVPPVPGVREVTMYWDVRVGCWVIEVRFWDGTVKKIYVRAGVRGLTMKAWEALAVAFRVLHLVLRCAPGDVYAGALGLAGLRPWGKPEPVECSECRSFIRSGSRWRMVG